MRALSSGLAFSCLMAVTPAFAVDYALSPVNAGPQAPTGYSSYRLYTDFNSGAPAALTGGSLHTGTNPTIWAAPFGDTTQYYAVGPEAGSPASIAINNFNRVSLYWGSVDYYNTISFLGAGGSVIQAFTGDQILGGSSLDIGQQSYTVTFTLKPSEAAAVTGIRFASTINAFEFDNLAIGTAVPEPAAWAMMIAGFGAIGGMARRRPRRVKVACGEAALA